MATQPAGRSASFGDQALGNVIKLLKHPATQALLRHAVRVATVQVVRAIRNRTRISKGHQSSTT